MEVSWPGNCEPEMSANAFKARTTLYCQRFCLYHFYLSNRLFCYELNIQIAIQLLTDLLYKELVMIFGSIKLQV